MSVTIRAMQAYDPEHISAAFKRIGWSKPVELYVRYANEQQSGHRHVFIAELDGEFAGYVTVIFNSGYPPFRDQGIPEIQDFNVLPQFRRRGIGSLLLDHAESLLAKRCSVIGIGVGMHEGYGSAQRLYVKRGFIPDGRGLTYGGRIAAEGETVKNDDSLVLYFTKRVN